MRSSKVALLLLFFLPVTAQAALRQVTVSNPEIYTAVFLVDTSADSVVWLSGADGSGPDDFWTPALPRTLTLSGSAGFDLPDDAAALREIFIDPDFSASPSDMWLAGYPSTTNGMLWNEGDSFLPANHAFIETGGSQLSIPIGSFISLGVRFSTSQGGGAELDPGWSVTVSDPPPPVPSLHPMLEGGLVLGLVAMGASLAVRTRVRVERRRDPDSARERASSASEYSDARAYL